MGVVFEYGRVSVLGELKVRKWAGVGYDRKPSV